MRQGPGPRADSLMDGGGPSGPDDWLHSTSRLRQTILPLAQLESSTLKSFLPTARRQNPILSRKLADTVGKLDLWIDFLESCNKYALDQISENTESLVLKLVFRTGQSLCELHAVEFQNAGRSASVAVNNLRDYIDEKVQRLLLQDESEDDEDDSSEAASDSGRSDASEKDANQLASSLTRTVSCLTRLTPVLETACIKALSEERSTPAQVATAFEPHGPADHYIRLIMDKFKAVDSDLANRLGEANWQRQERMRISASSDGRNANKSLADHLNIDQKSLFKPSSTFRDSALGSSVPPSTLQELNSIDVASLFSSASSRTGTSARLPSTPKEVEAGKPFECFICHEMFRHISSRAQWKFHVFQDLQPYICCRKFCTDTNVTFHSRQDWIAHDASKHSDEKTETKCPLCHKTCAGAGKEYARHVGRHLEAIALLALPPQSDDYEDSDASYESNFSTKTVPRSRNRTSSPKLKDLATASASPGDHDPKTSEILYTGSEELGQAFEYLKTILEDGEISKLEGYGNLLLHGIQVAGRSLYEHRGSKCGMFLFEKMLLGVPFQPAMPRIEIAMRNIVTVDIRFRPPTVIVTHEIERKGRKETSAYLIHFQERIEASKWKLSMMLQSGREKTFREPEKGHSIWRNLLGPPLEMPDLLRASGESSSDRGQDDEEDYQIHCICGFAEDDGCTVLCEQCNTWQHIACYYNSEFPLTDDVEHFCANCKPRSLDVAGARERQQAQRDTAKGEAYQHLPGIVNSGSTGSQTSRKSEQALHDESMHKSFIEPKQATSGTTRGTMIDPVTKPHLSPEVISGYMERLKKRTLSKADYEVFWKERMIDDADLRYFLTLTDNVRSDSTHDERMARLDSLLQNLANTWGPDDESMTIAASESTSNNKKEPSSFTCHLCQRKFTRKHNLRSHLLTHNETRPFACTICGRKFARQHDRKQHEGLHAPNKPFVCKGRLESGTQTWGCGRGFVTAGALSRHLRSEAGRGCIQPMLGKEAPSGKAPLASDASPGTSDGGSTLPTALLKQDPVLAETQSDVFPDAGDKPNKRVLRSSGSRTKESAV